MTALDTLDAAGAATLELLDDRAVEWHRAREAVYVLHQHARYTYPGAVRSLRQRLCVLPRTRHGEQLCVNRGVVTDARNAVQRERRDRFGNVVVEVDVPRVRASIDFSSWAVVVRRPDRSHPSVRAWQQYLRTTPLTVPDDALLDAAATIRGPRRRRPGVALAEQVCEWTGNAIAYEDGVTDVATTAAGALALGRGVCQDHAHVMVTLCRLLGIPARYVSGHLLGEGGSHAWVEVLVPDASGRARVTALDPTHRRRTGPAYLTVAVGRDYRDVAPLSGTYVSPLPGTLTVTKRAGVARVEYSA